MIIPFKNRKLNPNLPVELYRNLHAKTKQESYSVKQNGLVIGHTNCLTLTNCEFKVNQGGRNRVLKEKRKNVHALIKGNVAVFSANIPLNNKVRVIYNPYKNNSFVYFRMEDTPIFQALVVSVEPEGIFVDYPN